MKKIRKEFDAVGTMREIRDRLSNEVEGMTFEEEKLFIQKRITHSRPQRPRQQARRTSQPTRVIPGARARKQA